MGKIFRAYVMAMSVLALCSLSMSSADARARKGGHFVGGTGSHHKGGHEVGGH